MNNMSKKNGKTYECLSVSQNKAPLHSAAVMNHYVTF